MAVKILTDVVSATLAKALDGTSARHKALANNIANVDTPGYRRTDVSFHEQLQAAFESARGNENGLAFIERVRPQTFADRTRSTRLDGNNVAIEAEMGELAKNTLEYEANVQLLKGKGRMLRTAITEGRK